MTTPPADTARPQRPLMVAWLVTALVVGPVGYLLFALSERSADRTLGLVLVVAALLALAMGATVLAAPDAARRWSLVLSAVLVALGVVAALAVLTGPAAFASDALLLGLPPVLGGLVTGALAARR